tara:strand:+ start:594 stop:728 length:135 start_codon:yes stop_codon:yes gene_type:complete
MAQAELFTAWIAEIAIDLVNLPIFPTARNIVTNPSRALGGNIIR